MTRSTMHHGLALAAASFVVSVGPSGSAEHVIRMEVSTFEPTMLTIAPGDSVRFVAATPGHNAQTIRGMLPEGAEAIAVPLDTETVITFTVEGIYGYRCAPHYGMGMVGIIQVGAPVNEAAAKAVTHQGMAAEAFTELLGNH